MSTVCLIASETPLPFIDMRTMKTHASEYGTVTCLEGFAVGERSAVSLEPENAEVGERINKPHVYDISLEADDACLEQLKIYIDHIDGGGSVEIWSVCPTGDVTKRYKNKIPLRHVKSADAAEDEIDWYKENYVEPTRVSVTLTELGLENLAFVLENASVCLEIKR